MYVGYHDVEVASTGAYGESACLVGGYFSCWIREVNRLYYHHVCLGAVRCCDGRRRHVSGLGRCLRCATDVLAGFLHVTFRCGYGGWEVLADEVGCQAGEGR